MDANGVDLTGTTVSRGVLLLLLLLRGARTVGVCGLGVGDFTGAEPPPDESLILMARTSLDSA